MISTRDAILKIGEELILDKGYNAFSYHDISGRLGVKNAAIHYYFPSKADLVVEVIRSQKQSVESLRDKVQLKEPMTKLKAFLQIYALHKAENKVCMVGSLATDLHSLDPSIEKELKSLTDTILIWVTETLEEGKTKGVFVFEGIARTKALMIITNMLAALQLSRLTGDADFKRIKDTIIKEIQQK